jgi:hypothetical protein
MPALSRAADTHVSVDLYSDAPDSPRDGHPPRLQSILASAKQPHSNCGVTLGAHVASIDTNCSPQREQLNVCGFTSYLS